MSDDLLKQMRAVRRHAELLNQTLVEDYRPFLNPHNKTTFFRLPTKIPKDGKDANSTPTCTALMSLCLNNGFKDVYETSTEEEAKARVKEAVELVLADNWETAQLSKNNAFTSGLTIRACALLVKSSVLDTGDLDALRRDSRDSKKVQAWCRFNGKSIRQICEILVDNSPEKLAVQEYPATPTIAYWVFDAAASMKLKISAESARAVVNWANYEFARQVSLVTSDHHSMMDPVSMAMAACLCRTLTRIAESQNEMHAAVVDASSPTDDQLLSAVRLFFKKQNSAGVWEKYFPLFHYPKAGPNHCWHCEVLEAVVNEFPDLLSESEILNRIDLTLDWLDRNRLEYQHKARLFSGWNSGGDLKALNKGEPESWPTGVAHMCLARLREKLSVQIRAKVLEKYRDRVDLVRRLNSKRWKSYLDCDLPGLGKKYKSVKSLLEKELLGQVEVAVRKQGKLLPGQTADQPRILNPSFSLTCCCSALLFGPPGTSKTSLVKALAYRLGWPFVELSPSDFLRGGLDGIYRQVNEVFEDLSDLYGVVILFDEMDALVQSRDVSPGSSGIAVPSGQLDVTQKFLTTSMLPKLLKLREQARTIFFMATNHQREFDAAIKRAGRFDLLIRMGPPSIKEKFRNLAKEWFKPEAKAMVDVGAIETIVISWMDDNRVKEQFGRFTYGETRAFFESIRRDLSSGSLKDIAQIGKERFKERLSDWAKDGIVLCDDSKDSGALYEFNKDAKEVKIQ